MGKNINLNKKYIIKVKGVLIPKIMLVLTLFIVICIPLLNVIYATSTLPTFAIVEATKTNENDNTTDIKAYITEESSIQTITTPTFNFTSKAQILIEESTGKVLYSNNELEHLHPASVTKIMTLILIMDAIGQGKLSLTDTVVCSANASKIGGSQIWFKEGEALTIDEALKCICVVSANDVCIAMAELIAGSEENFVSMMNERAKGLCMENTHFMNSHGIDEDEHYSCAKDIATMSRELVTKYPEILNYTTIWQDSIRNGEFILSSTNKLLKTYDGITGLKTGSTSLAGFNLSATATKNGLSLIAVVLGATTGDIRSQEITQMLNFGFANYKIEKIANKGDIMDEVYINKHIGEKISLTIQDDISIICEKGTDISYTKEVYLNENISAPINANYKLGEIHYVDRNGNIISTSNIIVTENVTKSSFIEYLIYILNIFK